MQTHVLALLVCGPVLGPVLLLLLCLVTAAADVLCISQQCVRQPPVDIRQHRQLFQVVDSSWQRHSLCCQYNRD